MVRMRALQEVMINTYGCLALTQLVESFLQGREAAPSWWTEGIENEILEDFGQ